MIRLATVCVAVIAVLGTSAAAAASSKVMGPDSCTLNVLSVRKSALMLYVGAHLEGTCRGQVAVDLEFALGQSGPWQVVDSTLTLPADPDAAGGTAWFEESYGCGYYRGVGAFDGLVSVSPRPVLHC
ncbi:MAG TPA: hypothetical protein DGT23_34095 [Micromonosporaceae bacterium]|nr:hypothetical protein [Micromonosporaceae bacterium]